MHRRFVSLVVRINRFSPPPMTSIFLTSVQRLAAFTLGLMVTTTVAGQEVDPAELFRKYQKSLVSIQSRSSLGSGSYIRVGNTTHIVTNIHVLAQSPSLRINGPDGRQVPLDEMAVSAAQDLAMLEADSGVTAFTLMTDMGKNVKIGDEIMLFTNNGGAGVFAPLQGRVTGIGARLIEIDVGIDAHSSGSPIVHLKTGKVIAIATRLPAERTVQSLLQTEDTTMASNRQFGQRMDLAVDWEKLTVPMFENELRQIDEVQKRTKELALLERSLRRVRFPNETLATGLTEPLRGQALTFARALTTAANDRARTAAAAASAARAAASVGNPLTQASSNPAGDAALRAGRERTSAEAKRAESTYNNLWSQYVNALRQATQSDIAAAKQTARTNRQTGLLDKEAVIRKQLLEQCITALEQLKQREPPMVGRGAAGNGSGIGGEEEP
jgi:hypothetical protein